MNMYVGFGVSFIVDFAVFTVFLQLLADVCFTAQIASLWAAAGCWVAQV